jgi:hypothetical protein
MVVRSHDPDSSTDWSGAAWRARASLITIPCVAHNGNNRACVTQVAVVFVVRREWAISLCENEGRVKKYARF